MVLVKFFIIGALYDCFKLAYVDLNEGDEVRECYNYLKLMIQAHFDVGFFKIFLQNMFHLYSHIDI